MAFNHKKADFWLPNFGFKSSLLSLLKKLWDKLYLIWMRYADNFKTILIFKMLIVKAQEFLWPFHSRPPSLELGLL